MFHMYIAENAEFDWWLVNFRMVFKIKLLINHIWDDGETLHTCL